MTNIDFNDGNKLIAEFMNLGKISENIYAVFIPDISSETLFLPLEQLRFEQKWNWLIPVIDKAYECQLFGSNNLINDIKENLVTLNIEETYKSVIEFIKYYNSQYNP